MSWTSMRVMRNKSHPTRLLPLYDSGDHLHPNDVGYEAMAKAVDLGILQRVFGHRGAVGDSRLRAVRQRVQ